MEIIKSNKGGDKACLNGYMYVVHRKSSATIIWKCSNRSSLKCKGALKTTLSNPEPSEIESHNHPADRKGVEAMKIVQDMKLRANDTLGRPSQIFAEAVQNIDDSVRMRMPLQEATKRTLRNHKAKDNPVQPGSLTDLIIEGDWASTGNDGSRFLMSDNGPDAEQRIVIFATDSSLKYLNESTEWFMDGNFSLAPPLFQQLYVIRVLVNNIFITAVYCLLQRKTQETYEEMLRSIIQKCDELDFHPDPLTIHVDFEQAVIQALKNVIGEHISISGCFYHLAQSTFRKIKELGLQVVYKQDDEVNHFCGMLDGLAFLPVGDVIEGMDFLKEQTPPQLQPLVEYFDATYVTGTYRRVRSNTDVLRLRNIPPRFPPPLWNVQEATINDQHRTNNTTEGWNNRFFHLVGQKHPTIWTLIRKMQQEVATDRTKLLQFDAGEQEKKKTRKQHEKHQEKLKNLCVQYQNSDIASFLRAVGHTIRFRPDSQ